MISVLSVDGQVFLVATALMPSIMAVMNLATLPWSVPQDSFIRNTMPPWQISFKTLIHPQLEGQITLLLWSRYRRHYNRSHFHPIDRSSSFRRHTAHSSLHHHSSSCHPSGDECCHFPSCHSHTPSHTHHFSHRHHSTTPQTKASLAPATSTMPHKDLSPEKSSNSQGPQCPQTSHHPKTVTIQDSPPDFSLDSDSNSDPLNYLVLCQY